MNKIEQLLYGYVLYLTGRVPVEHQYERIAELDEERFNDQLYTLIKNEVIDKAKARPGRTIKEDAAAKLDALFGKES